MEKDELSMILELNEDGKFSAYKEPFCEIACKTEEDFNNLQNVIEIGQKASTLKEWNKNIGDCLWWKLPIEEPPYVGSPLSDDWNDEYTHFTEIIVPEV